MESLECKAGILLFKWICCSDLALAVAPSTPHIPLLEMHLNNQSLGWSSLELIYGTSHAARLRQEKANFPWAIKGPQGGNEDYIPHYRQGEEESKGKGVIKWKWNTLVWHIVFIFTLPLIVSSNQAHVKQAGYEIRYIDCSSSGSLQWLCGKSESDALKEVFA